MSSMSCGRAFSYSLKSSLSLFLRVPNITLKRRSNVKCFSASYPIFRAKDENLSSVYETEDSKDDVEYDSWIQHLYRNEGLGHRVFLVQPDNKWRSKTNINTTPYLQLAEAAALAETLPKWKVIEKRIVTVKEPKKKYIFTSGILESLTDEIRSCKVTKGITAVFLSCDMITGLQQTALENLFGLPVYDRYMIVLRIFRDHARTKEAKLQIALAEIPYLKSRFKKMLESTSFRGNESSYIRGCGETFVETRRRILAEKEIKLKKALDQIKSQRYLLREGRKRKDFPIIAVVGYTNAGKTSLIKTMTGESELEPKDQLFATLDVTAHSGKLPNSMTVLYIDTVGFISDIPTELIRSFAATLEDMLLADLIIHVCDVSHPDYVAQKQTVHATLRNLGLEPQLLENMIEVDNKIDLIPESQRVSKANILPVSFITGHGINDLGITIQEKLLQPDCKNMIVTFRVQMGSQESRWLYKEASVMAADADADPQFLIIKAIMTKPTLSKFRHRFGNVEI